MTGAKTYFVTTAIDYVNNLPHIGTAYEKICADVIARFKRLEGEPVFFLMGNDEHSINVKREAQARGLEPHAYCDQMADQFRQIWKSLGISYDAFIRTTEERHAEAVGKLFQRIYENGDIYPSKYCGLYCESCETFYREKDLDDGKCPQHGSEPKWIEEDNYFFALSRYTEKILKTIEEKRLLILPEIRKNEIVNILHGGLEDISISRSSFDWGIPLPIQPDHVIYVWFDALINYISAIGFGWDEDLFPQFWPADMHIIGKDITRFHCIIWPAMLLSAGLEVPRMVFGHGFVFLKGEKMSKTLGNVVTPMDIVDVYGPDALRYYLLRDSSFGKDGNFTWENFLERYNGDLANDFGNLLQRVLTMIRRYRSGTIPTPHTLDEDDEALKKDCLALCSDVRTFLDPARGDVDFHLALARLWETIRHTNQYIDHTAPWTLEKEGAEERLDTVLSCAAESLRIIGAVLSPFLPGAASGLFAQLGLPDRPDKLPAEAPATWGQIPPGTKVRKPKPLFPRIVVEEEGSEPPEKPKAKQKEDSKKEEEVTIDQFDRFDLRAGRIIQAERVPNTEKLLKLTVDIGERRTIVASIGKALAPEEVQDRTVVVIANLKPVRIRGILSEGMLLAAGTDEALSLVTLSGHVAPGEKIR
ncbi:MAG: methionine--tRNA ligase [Thermodesulfobacteriota bacterium]